MTVPPDLTGPLAGVLVVDLSRALAGPHAAMMLGDLGARVIKVENPDGGDDSRGWGPPFVGPADQRESTYFFSCNRNKESVTADLKSDEGRELLTRLVRHADVLVENFRTGVMERLGLGYDDVRAANPAVVYCSITGFGSGAAAAALPGYDLLVQALGGLMSITGEEDGRPLKVGAAVVDLVCGLLAVIGIQAALAERERTGRGRHVEVSLMDAALTSLLNQGSAWVLGGVVPHRRGNRHPSITPYETFEAADRPLAVAVGNDRLFARLCDALGLPELPGDARFATNAARVAHADELAQRLEAVFRTRPAAEWVAALRAAAVPAGQINDVAEAFALAESLGMEPVREVGGYPLPTPPLRLDGERPAIRRPPPKLDEHGAELRAWLGRN